MAASPQRPERLTGDMGCLLLQGAGVSGSYTPVGFEIRGSGLHESADLFAHLHEGHHAALNDTTSWGSALHVTSRVGELIGVYQSLLDQCRRTHETFATLAPITMLRERHPDLVDYIRATYPEYGRWHDAAVPLADSARGPNRRYLLATQYARVAMQTTVLDGLLLMLEAGVENGQALPPPRRWDTPDARWGLLVRAGPGLAAAAATSADEAASRLHDGAEVLEVDTDPNLGADEGAESALHPEHDEVWAAWERAAYAVLASYLSDAGATVLAFDGHQEPTRAVVTAVKRLYPDIALGAALETGESRSDAQIAGALLDHGRHVVAAGDRWPAALRSLNGDTLADLVEDPVTIQGHPVLVIDVRPPGRLTQLYRWRTSPSPDDAAGSAEVFDRGPGAKFSPGPLVAVRRVRASGDDNLLIEHTVVPDPASLGTLVSSWRQHWQQRGDPYSESMGPAERTVGSNTTGKLLRPVACVSASTLTDKEWTSDWWRPLAASCEAFVLLDVELGRVLPGWVESANTEAGARILLGRVQIDDSSGIRHAVVIQPSSSHPPWVSLHDDLGAGLVVQSLRNDSNVDLTITAEHLEPRRWALTVLLTHLLATESFFDAAALGHRRS